MDRADPYIMKLMDTMPVSLSVFIVIFHATAWAVPKEPPHRIAILRHLKSILVFEVHVDK